MIDETQNNDRKSDRNQEHDHELDDELNSFNTVIIGEMDYPDEQNSSSKKENITKKNKFSRWLVLSKTIAILLVILSFIAVYLIWKLQLTQQQDYEDESVKINKTINAELNKDLRQLEDKLGFFGRLITQDGIVNRESQILELKNLFLSGSKMNFVIRNSFGWADSRQFIKIYNAKKLAKPIDISNREYINNHSSISAFNLKFAKVNNKNAYSKFLPAAMKMNQNGEYIGNIIIDFDLREFAIYLDKLVHPTSIAYALISCVNQEIIAQSSDFHYVYHKYSINGSMQFLTKQINQECADALQEKSIFNVDYYINKVDLGDYYYEHGYYDNDNNIQINSIKENHSNKNYQLSKLANFPFVVVATPPAIRVNNDNLLSSLSSYFNIGNLADLVTQSNLLKMRFNFWELLLFTILMTNLVYWLYKRELKSKFREYEDLPWFTDSINSQVSKLLCNQSKTMSLMTKALREIKINVNEKNKQRDSLTIDKYYNTLIVEWDDILNDKAPIYPQEQRPLWLGIDFLSEGLNKANSWLQAVKSITTNIIHYWHDLTEIEKYDFVKQLEFTSKELLELHQKLEDLADLLADKTYFEFACVNLVRLTSEVMHEYRQSYHASKIFKIRFTPTDVQSKDVRADRSRIKEIINYLISNAVEFTNEDNSIITIEMDIIEIYEQNDQPKKMVHFSISDQGVGINQDNFDKFFAALRNESSIEISDTKKLEIAICYMIIRAHGGVLWATNNANIGATFHFTLPAY